MKKRKITKFSPLCPSDISPYKGATKQEVTPLYKGRLGGVCAFTLVELIVVVSILAILGTISFIAFQGFAIEARDAKRITDIKGLIDKVNIEQVKGVPLSSLITEEETHSTKINGQSNNNGTYQGIINFEIIREDPKNFQDPLTKINYPFAYAEGTTQVNGVNQLYKFMQIATINERNGTTQLVGNYFKYDEQDDESLFVDENGDVMENGEPPMIYEPNNNAQNETETSPSSSGGGESCTDYTLTSCPINGNCSMCEGKYKLDSCSAGYSESDNSCTAVNGVSHNAIDGEITVSYNGEVYTIQDKNLGSSIVGITSESYGNYYQWGNNYGFSNSGTIIISSTQITNASSYGPGTANGHYSSTDGIWRYGDNADWANPQNDNLWGNNGTNTDKQGPCEDGRHVPSTLEWDGLVQTWFTIKGENCTVNVGYGCFWSGDASLANFQSDLKLPRAGWIQRENASIGTQEYYGNYWSSSPNDTLHATPNTFGARNLFIYDVFIAPQGSTFRAYGLSVRCFKN